MTIKVYYPHEGKKFLLEWYTYNERSHIVLADTERSMMETAKTVCIKMGAEVRESFALEIVSPSEQFTALKAARDHKDAVDGFLVEAASNFRQLIDKDIPLPAPFKKCDEYVDQDNDPDPAEDDWKETSHYSCKNCEQRVQLIGMSKEELYDKYQPKWLALHPRYVDTKLVESKAAIANDDDELWVVSSGGFGHHGSGIAFDKAEIDGGMIDSPLFFFKRLHDLDTSSLKTLLVDEKERNKRGQARREDDRRARFEADEKKRIDDLIALFS
jgi:hypothetical protein